MAEITDVEKLRPELLNKSMSELERMESEIQMAKREIEKKDAEKRRQEEFEESLEVFDTMVKAIGRLYELGRLPDRLVAALSNDAGEFSPGRYLKKPRS